MQVGSHRQIGEVFHDQMTSLNRQQRGDSCLITVAFSFDFSTWFCTHERCAQLVHCNNGKWDF